MKETLFYTAPKDDPRSLFAREKELYDLMRYLQDKRWVVLLGPRRVGKTSLAQCAIKKSGFDSIVLDARQNSDFAVSLLSALSNESSVSVGGNLAVPSALPASLGFSYSKQNPMQGLDSLLKKRNRRLILLLDEVQWFRNPRQVIKLLAHIYDYHYDRVTPIITGSAVGVMRSILEPGEKSPIYGRPAIQMEVRKWVPSTSLRFLEEGVRQYRIEVDEKILAKTVDMLDGIPGWLTMFGFYFTAEPSDYDGALRKTIREALKIVNEETTNISKFARGWQSHRKILQSLVSGSKSFKDLLEATQQTNSALSEHLDMLQRLCYVEKNLDGRYVIVDPMFTQLLKRG
ncbi:MAG: AAA family ATPase [Nitrososphaerales archaeon]